MGVTEDLARMAVETPGETLSAGPILESVKMRILDGIAIMLAGSREPATLISLDLVRSMGGAQAVSIPGHPDRAPAPLAGYVNGVSAHSQEYDDYTRGGGHLSVSLVPGSLAIAEDAALSGRGLIEGFVIGFEIATRIAHGMNPHLFDGGFHQNCLFGALGVATAGARIRGFDQLRTRMAIGIAASEGTGLRRNVGSMAKAFHVGHGVRNGIFAAMLAERGYCVHPDIIEGTDEAAHARFGLVDTYNGQGNYALEKMTEGLGEVWELARDTTVVCFHPGSTTQAAAIDAVIELADEHDIKPAEVERIELACTPEALKRACYMEPRTAYEARYSLRYGAAVALIDRRAGLAQYTDERVVRADVQALMERIRVFVPKDLERHVGNWEGDVNWAEMRIAVHLRDGRELRHGRSHARGWPEDVPVTLDDVAEKFSECAEGLLTEAQRDETISMVRDLERLADVRALMAALRPA